MTYSLGNCRSILLSYGTTRAPIAGFFARCILLLLAFLPAPGAVTSLLAAPCDPSDAIETRITAIEPDGTFVLDGRLPVRLHGVIWPDRLEPRARAALAETLRTALDGQIVSWKLASAPDRWGITGVHLFVREDQPFAPFWLQAGLVERGLAPIWPDGLGGECLKRLEAHEMIAITRRLGYWAPRAQPARIAAIEQAVEAQAGRKFAFLVDVASIRPWRGLHFINRRGDEKRHGRERRIGIALPNAIVSQLTQSGDNPREWGGRRVLLRVVLPPEGLRRLRVENAERLRNIAPSPADHQFVAAPTRL